MYCLKIGTRKKWCCCPTDFGETYIATTSERYMKNDGHVMRQKQ